MRRDVAFASPFPGKIQAIDLKKWRGTIIAQKDAFLCGARCYLWSGRSWSRRGRDAACYEEAEAPPPCRGSCAPSCGATGSREVPSPGGGQGVGLPTRRSAGAACSPPRPAPRRPPSRRAECPGADQPFSRVDDEPLQVADHDVDDVVPRDRARRVGVEVELRRGHDAPRARASAPEGGERAPLHVRLLHGDRPPRIEAALGEQLPRRRPRSRRCSSRGSRSASARAGTPRSPRPPRRSRPPAASTSRS